ncbi:MAG: tRNA (guanine(46)-N(7))-methyltransferase TrmB [Rhodospirillaceae bacterium]
MSAAAPTEDQRWYGRRTGRKLTAARQRLMDERLPVLRVDPAAVPADLRALFDAPVREVWMEIGFGAGEHLAGQAARHPDIGFIGCEPYVNGVASLLAMAEDAGLANIRLFDDDVRQLLPALPDGGLGRLYALFSDPWPKLRHHRRRITVPGNLAQFARLLAPGAELRFATDQHSFAAWTLERLLREPGFEWLARRPADWRDAPDGWIETRYQVKARGRGLAPIYLNARRRA